MQFQAPKLATPQPGETRLVKRFAFYPRYIVDRIIWLEYYDVLQAFIITGYTVIVDKQQVAFSVGKWISLSKRLR